jgi:dipeptidyl aminopeptidase/acylaminoacyl peptidase
VPKLDALGLKLASVVVMCVSFVTSGEAQDHLQASDKSGRWVTEADIIGMTTLGNWKDLYTGASSTSAGLITHFSPDGSKFVVVARKGNLKDNTIEYSLLLWHTSVLLRTPTTPPQKLVTMPSSSSRDAITDVTWLADNDTVMFLGRHPGEAVNLYGVSVHGGTLKKYTSSTTDIDSYSVAPQGGTVVYVQEPNVASVWDEKAMREGIVVLSQPASELLLGQKNSHATQGGTKGNPQLWVVSKAGKPKAMDLRGRINDWGPRSPFISPNGRFIAIPLQSADIPDSWNDYTDPGIRYLVRRGFSNMHSLLVRWELIDTLTGEQRVLLNSPRKEAVAGSVAVWSPDSKSVALSNVFLPLDGTTGEELSLRKSTAFSVVVDIQTGALRRISGEALLLRAWNANPDCLAAQTVNNETASLGPQVSFCRDGQQWKKNTDSTQTKDLPEIDLEQDMNSPPKLFVVNDRTHEHHLFFDPNPQFSELAFARVEEIEWKSSEGAEVKGGLYYPRDYVPGKRYPLVIQTHGWSRAEFRPDGPSTTAFAAQALAAAGIVVLQIGEFDKLSEFMSVANTPKEASLAVAMYEGAIEFLDAKGLIDRNRVGLIGWSRTCYYVKYAMTHSRYKFGAATVVDGFDEGYLQYVLSAYFGPEFSEHNFEGVYGGPPFGEGLNSWIKNAPDFSFDKIHTPLLIQTIDPIVAMVDLPWLGALRRLRKPVEMILIRDDLHELQRPWDRMISQQGDVDWFRWWLKGDEDPDPAKIEKYARWREMKNLQEIGPTRSIGTVY